MPGDDQLAAMLDSVGATGWEFDAVTEREERVIARQFAELAFLVCSRVPAGGRRTSALTQLRNVRDATIDAYRRGGG